MRYYSSHLVLLVRRRSFLRDAPLGSCALRSPYSFPWTRTREYYDSALAGLDEDLCVGVGLAYVWLYDFVPPWDDLLAALTLRVLGEFARAWLLRAFSSADPMKVGGMGELGIRTEAIILGHGPSWPGA